MTDRPESHGPSEERQFSDLSMSRVECPKCGATWINDQHYWSGTGRVGNELDLAGLVCNSIGDFQCINPKKGQTGGDSWEKRMEDLDKFAEDKGNGETKWWDKMSVSEERVQEMIDDAIRKHNRNASIISMCVGWVVLALFAEGLLRLIGVIPPLLPCFKITL